MLKTLYNKLDIIIFLLCRIAGINDISEIEELMQKGAKKPRFADATISESLSEEELIEKEDKIIEEKVSNILSDERMEIHSFFEEDDVKEILYEINEG